MPTLTVDDFIGLFGTETAPLPEKSLHLIKTGNWNYKVIEETERDQLILRLLKGIEEKQFSVVANSDNSRWVKGWGENLKAFTESGNIDALVPKYYRPDAPLRLNRQFIQPEDPAFEINFFYIYRRWIFENYLKNYQTIFELGSGSGFNAAELAHIYPSKTIHGLDWALPAVAILETLRKTKSLNIYGHQFDFFHPDQNFDVPADSAFYSFGAFEQLATDWQPILDFILAKKPAIVLHIEPILEWYEPQNSLVDYTATQATRARNYLKGYASAIEALEKQGRARILKAKRLDFGSTWHEGWSQLFWQPL